MGQTVAVSLLAAGLVVGAWGRAAAEPDGDGEPRLITPDRAPPPPPPPGIAPDRQRSHKHQFGLSAQFVTGTRFIKTYHDEFCGDRAGPGTNSPNATYCFSRVPVALDLVASYGLTDKIELLLEMRLGLERDFGNSASDPEGPRLRHYAPGIKFYYSDRGLVKFFSTAQIALDATGYEDPSGAGLGADVLFRNANGIHLDFHDAYGVYAFFGEEVAFVRWLEAGLEFGVGIQGRYP